MNITKKFDRAFQWAGEKMGGEAKTTMSEDFKMMETEMALRFEGMERLQRSMNQYVKWMGRHLEPSEDREKGLPVGFLGRTMVGHGEEFQADSEFGNCLITMGRANERVSAIQEAFVSEATASWLESLERSLAMMKEYQNARKKLENRRLNYDASISKQQKAKRDDFRLEEELRGAKAKYEESSEDVLRRMQDVQDAEADSVRDLTHFLDAEIDYHERCADELRRVRQNWPGHASPPRGCYSPERRPTVRRSNTGHSFTERLSRQSTLNSTSIPESYETEPAAPPVRMPIRTQLSRTFSHRGGDHLQADGPVPAPRPAIGSTKPTSFQQSNRIPSGGSNTPTPVTQGHNVGSLRGQLRPVVSTRFAQRDHRDESNNVFADNRDDDTASDTGSPGDHWGNRSVASSVTSVGSLSRTNSNGQQGVIGGGYGAGAGGGFVKKAPPPPPPSRAKKPAPPVPARREFY